MFELFQPLVVGPVLPATILLGLLLLGSLLTISLGIGVDLETPFSSYLESWIEPIWDTLGSLLMLPMKWLNLRDVPFLIWISVFSLVWWTISIGLWLLADRHYAAQAHTLVTLLLVSRNIAIALPLTKLATTPLLGSFSENTIQAQSLLGSEAEIWSYDASTSHGQAKYRTDGAPLLLNIRTDGPDLPKGTRVWITHYDSNRRIYIVSATTTTTPATSPPARKS